MLHPSTVILSSLAALTFTGPNTTWSNVVVEQNTTLYDLGVSLVTHAKIVWSNILKVQTAIQSYA